MRLDEWSSQLTNQLIGCLWLNSRRYRVIAVTRLLQLGVSWTSTVIVGAFAMSHSYYAVRFVASVGTRDQVIDSMLSLQISCENGTELNLNCAL